MSDEELHAAARRAVSDAPAGFVMIAYPKPLVVELRLEMSKVGLGFEIADDGEDGGPPLLVTKPMPEVMDWWIGLLRKQFKISAWAFVMATVVELVAILWVGGGDAQPVILLLSPILMVGFGVQTIREHRAWEKATEHQQWCREEMAAGE